MGSVLHRRQQSSLRGLRIKVMRWMHHTRMPEFNQCDCRIHCHWIIGATQHYQLRSPETGTSESTRAWRGLTQPRFHVKQPLGRRRSGKLFSENLGSTKTYPSNIKLLEFNNRSEPTAPAVIHGRLSFWGGGVWPTTSSECR